MSLLFPDSILEMPKNILFKRTTLQGYIIFNLWSFFAYVYTLQRLTAGLLLALSALTASRQFFGEPIHCHLGHGAVAGKVFESYCWMSSTYTLMGDTKEDNATLLHGAVGQGSGREDLGNLHHNYYQWVGLLLVLQAALTYVPWAAWKWAEGGRVGGLLAGVKRDPMTETAVEEQVRRERLGLTQILIDICSILY